MMLRVFIFSLIVASCNTTPQKLTIETQSKILVDQDKCKVVSFYPVAHAKKEDHNLQILNEHLESLNEMDRFADCAAFFPEESRNKQKTIIGGYHILFRNDSLLNIEYVVEFKGLSKTRYRNIFFTIPGYQLIAPEQAMPNMQRGKLYPYVKRFSDSTGININLKAYEKDSRYMILFGRTADSLVLYLGGEGEAEGYHKLLLPLKNVIK